MTTTAKFHREASFDRATRFATCDVDIGRTVEHPFFNVLPLGSFAHKPRALESGHVDRLAACVGPALNRCQSLSEGGTVAQC